MILPLMGAAWLLAFASIAVWDAPWWMVGAWCAALVPLACAKAGLRAGAWLAVVALVTLAGGARYHWGAPAGPPDLVIPYGEEVRLHGTVSSEPDPGLTTVRYRVDIDSADGVDGLPSDVAVLITVNQYARFLPGDRLLLAGELEVPADDLDGFDYRAYLLSRGVVGTMLFPHTELLGDSGPSLERSSTRLRLAIERALQVSLPEPEASLAAGIAVGRDDSMPPDLVDDFRASGLAHLTAVSGGNVAILAALVFVIAVPLVGRYGAVPPSLLVLGFYLAAAGFEPTIVRASIMAAVFLVGLWLGRPQSGLAGLSAAAIVMTAVDPAVSREAGFQLSLAATAGLILFAPWLQHWTDRALAAVRVRGIAGSVPSQALALTASATLATLPIVAHTFGRVSLIGLAANVAAEPLFLLAFPFSLLAAASGLAWEPAGWLVGLVAYYPLAAIETLARWSAAVPGASVSTGGLSGTATLAWMAILAAVGAFLYRRAPASAEQPQPTTRDRVARRGLFAAGAGLVAAWVGVTSLAPIGGPGRLEIHTLDVGQGDAILVRAPGGETLLVDGGPSGLQAARELGEVLPHWQRSIDLVVLTHPQQDHVAGLVEVLRRYDVSLVATTGTSNDTLANREFRRRGGDPLVLHAGDVIDLGDVRVEVLWPPSTAVASGGLNDTSLVLRIVYGDTSALLTGDIEAPAQGALLASGEQLGAQVLKVPHHGAATSRGSFFEAVGASVALISAGEGNRFGHPAVQTLTALSGASIFRTDLDGRIVLRSDGHSWTFETDR